MKAIFISVPTKLLMLIVSALLIISVGFSLLSLMRLQAEYKNYQQENLRQGQAQVELHKEVLSNQLQIWLVSFADMVGLKAQNDFELFASELNKQYDALQLHLDVENIWLYGAQQQLFYGTATMPANIEQRAQSVLQTQQPSSEFYCAQQCVQLVIVPLMDHNGMLAVVAVTSPLTNMLYAINHTLNSEVAVVGFAHSVENATSTPLPTLLSSSNLPLIQALFTSVNSAEDVDVLHQQGMQIDFAQANYLVNLMLLAKNQQQAYYLAIIENVSILKQERDNYRFQFLLSALIIFIGLAVFSYWVTSPFTNRLLLLANTLPLLARKEFEQFRQVKLGRNRMTRDELDILADSVTELNHELEQLNLTVEQKTQELENIAMYDLLTGLPNRNMLNYQLKKAVANLERKKGKIAVLFLDLDDFKKINDSHGHAEGDRLLIEAANRIRLAIRKVDLVCRFGGDEFVVVLDPIHTIEDAEEVAEKILGHFKAPIKVGASWYYISTSIGITFCEDCNAKFDDLVRQADMAMYEAKNGGSGQYHLYNDEMLFRVAQRLTLETEVKQALAKGQFSLSLQPQISAGDNKLFGFEALLRWHHPERGMVPPDEFIPILENSEYMIELGYWIIRRCFEIVEQLQRNGFGDARVAINLSAGQFVDPQLAQFLQTLLAEFALPAHLFELELTEQTLVKDIDQAIAVMQQLKTIGFSFAIDDFGTGYSSLAYLKKMPVDVIKIDKSFVFGMLENDADYQIIISTIGMVKNLGLTVVAEGVETAAQLRSLRHNDCDLIQGYYFSKPIPEAELLVFLEHKVSHGIWKTPSHIQQVG